MIKQLVYILIFTSTFIDETSHDEIRERLEVNGLKIVKSESVNRNIFEQNLTGKKYTFKYDTPIETACHLFEVEYADCNSIIDFTHFDIQTNPDFEFSSIDEIYLEYIEQLKNSNIPEDEIEFMVAHVPEGLKKVRAGLLSIDEDEITFLTNNQLISIKLNTESSCKVNTVLHYFYRSELSKVLQVERAELEWMKVY